MKKPIVLEAHETEKFRYMMLSRLQSDCLYFLGWGKFHKSILRDDSINVHITEMKRLLNSLPIKPEWLTLEDIINYESIMNNKTPLFL
jgi:hypothetical protein